MILTTRSASTFLIAGRLFYGMNRRMSSTRSSAKSTSAESLNLPSHSYSEAENATSESKTRVSLRKKRLRQEDLKPVEKDSTQEMCELPDIEEFSYKETNGSSSSRTAKLNSNIKGTETSTAGLLIKAAGRPPENWEKVLEGIRKMRSSEEAPDDTIECDRTGSFLPPKVEYFPRYGKLEVLTIKCPGKHAVRYDHYFLNCYLSLLHYMERRFYVLIGTLLSSQTKEHITGAAVKRLHHSGILTPEAIDKADESTIKELIYPVGFYTRKATNMKKVAKICLTKYDGDIPSSLEELLSLSGVGPKIALLGRQEHHPILL